MTPPAKTQRILFDYLVGRTNLMRLFDRERRAAIPRVSFRAALSAGERRAAAAAHSLGLSSEAEGAQSVPVEATRCDTSTQVQPKVAHRFMLGSMVCPGMSNEYANLCPGPGGG